MRRTPPARGWLAMPALLLLAVATAAADAPPSAAIPLAGARERGFATLDDCFQSAVAKNERIGLAREDLVQTELLRSRALAGVLPQVTGEANYYAQNHLPPGVIQGGSSSQAVSSWQSEANVRLQQLIFSGFRERNAFPYADRTIEAARFALEDQARQLYADVAAAFYLVLERESAVQILEDTVKVERERVKEISARRDVGLARKTEVLLIDSQLAEDQSNLDKARNDVMIARQALGFLAGEPVELPLSDTLEVPAPAAGGDDEEALVAEALANRSDVKQRERLVQAADRRVAIAKGAWWPTVTFEGNYYLDRQNYTPYLQNTDWTVELKLAVPIFEGGRIRADVAGANSSLRQAELDLSQQERRVRTQVETAWRELLSDMGIVTSLESRVASAEENYNLVQEEYRSGLATNLEVFTAQNQLLSGRLDLERRRYLVKVDWIALKVTQGLLPGPGIPGDAATGKGEPR